MIFLKDIAIRAFRTFWQAAVASGIVAVGAGVNLTDKQAVIALITGAVGAGLSAAWNVGVSAINGGAKL